MKKQLLLLAAFTLLMASCTPTVPYRQNDLRGYHFGKGHHYGGKYHGARYRYNWERKFP